MTLLKSQVIAKQKNKFLENDVAILQSKLYGMKPVITKLIMPICLMFLFSLKHINAQCLTIPVLATFNNQGLIMNDTVYPLSDNHRIKFESFKFYMTNVVFSIKNKKRFCYRIVFLQVHDTVLKRIKKYKPIQKTRKKNGN